MPENPTFASVSRIASALIVGISLVYASGLLATKLSLISHDFSVSLQGIPVPASASNAVITNPHGPTISQASAALQFRKQMSKVSATSGAMVNGAPDTLTDVKVKRVTYSSSYDEYQITYEVVWSTSSPAYQFAPRSARFANDGYGQYFTTERIGSGPTSVELTLKP